MSNHEQVIALGAKGKPDKFSPEQCAAWCVDLERYLRGPPDEHEAWELIIQHSYSIDMAIDGIFFL